MSSIPLNATGARADIPTRLLPGLMLAALILASLAPVALVEIPAMVDYPNHLARMSVLARAGTAAASPFYETAWALYPNLAMDLLVPPLARLIGVETATRLFYMTGQCLVLGGAMAIAGARGRSVIVPGIAAATMLYSLPFAWGFVNFEFALGLALCGIALWIGLETRPRLRLVVHCLAVPVLFVAHLFALGIYGVTIGICEIWRLRRERAGRGAAAESLAAMAAPALLMAALLFASNGGIGGDRNEWGLPYKVLWIFCLNGYSRELSIVLTTVLAVVGYGAARHGWLRFEGPGSSLAVGFAALFVAMPFRVFDTACADVRVLVGAALILPAFVRIRAPRTGWRIAATAAIGAVVVVNLAFTAWVQASFLPDYRALVKSFALLRPASRVLVAHSGEGDDPPQNLLAYPMYHAPTLAVHYADAEVPTLFTYPGKQPLVTRPEYRDLDIPEGGPAPIGLLAAIAEGRPGLVAPRFIARWPETVDYIYLLGPGIENPLPRLLEPMASSTRFTLFRVLRPART